MDLSPNKAAVSPAVLSMDPVPSPAALPRMNVSAQAVWGRAQSATGEVPHTHVMGVAEYWPALSKASTTPAAAPSSSQHTRVASLTKTLPTNMTCHGDHAALACPEPALDQRHYAVPKSPSPEQAPHDRSNGDVPRHRNGRFPPRHHSRGGHNAGNRRKVDGGNFSGIGDNNANLYGYGNRGVLRHGHEHRGGSDGQHRGRGHQGGGHAPGHRHHGHHMPPPPLLPFFSPPPFYGAYYGPSIGYAQTEFAPVGRHVPLQPPPPDAHFATYPALPVHAVLPPMEQEAAKPHAQEPDQLQTSMEDLQEKIRCQIEFYFSENNLCCNLHLKEQMDEQGWVPLTKIASFNRVKGLTTDLGLILRSLASSTEVEVQDGRIRRRVGWQKYILHRHFHSNFEYTAHP